VLIQTRVITTSALIDEKVKFTSIFPALENNNVFHLWRNNNCTKIEEKNRPIYNQSNWISMRKMYNEMMGSSNLTFKRYSSSLEYSETNGFKIKYSVNYNSNKNERSLFSSENIKKGQIVYEHKWLSEFPDPKTFLDFLNRLPTDLVCDTIEWGYDFETEESFENASWLSIDLDDMSYCNGEGEANIDYDYSGTNIIALRHINMGEELICYNGDNSIISNIIDSSDNHSNFFWELNKCREVIKKKRPIFGRLLWNLMEKTYQEVVGENSTLNETAINYDGHKVKYSVNHTENRGRGLFAREKIKKGQLVYDQTRTAYFRNDESLNEFINIIISHEHKRSINYPNPEPYLDFINHFAPGLACDIEMWLEYDIDEAGIEFDNSRYGNSAGNDDPNYDFDPNDGMGATKMYALRDIDVGEELLCPYEF